MKPSRIAAVTLISTLAVALCSHAQTQPGDPTDRFLEVNGLRLHVVDWGHPEKPPMIMVHGLDRVARTFDHLARHFADRYHVLAVDMRGHGDSSWDPQGRYLVEDHVTDLEQIVRQLGLRGIVLWGNSTGGRVVQVFAGLHPDLISAVISEDVGPERPRQIADSYSRRVAQEAAGWASEDELRATIRQSNPRMSQAVLDAYVKYGSKRDGDGRVVWKRDPKLVNGFVATDLWRFVRNITAPILYVIGGRSAIVPKGTQEELKTALPRARLVTVEGTGHYPSDEKPEVVIELVEQFLASSR
jgi:esterase